MTPIIFLDIDGVLVTSKTLAGRSGLRAVADPKCVYALNWLTTTTHAEIVISSSWRFCGLEEMRLILRHWGVSAGVVGLTPDNTRREESGVYVAGTRGSEIQAWLSGSPTEAFVILDDDADMGDLAPWLVRTKFETGLTEADAMRAVNILERAR